MEKSDFIQIMRAKYFQALVNVWYEAYTIVAKQLLGIRICQSALFTWKIIEDYCLC